MNSEKEHIDYLRWIKIYPPIVLGVFGLNYLFGISSWFYNSIYLGGIFQVLRVVYDYTLGWSPIPSFYLILILLLFLIYRFIRLVGQSRWRTAVKYLLSFLVIVFCLFYFLWGFNYKDKGIVQRMSLSSIDISKEDLKAEIDKVSQFAIRHRSEEFIYPPNAEKLIRISQKELLKEIGIPTLGRVRVRKLRPKGLLLRLSTAGIYIPYTMEGHIDGGLHVIQWAATMAHEMAHGYGVTDEGTCNFIAYLTCLKTENKEIQYSGSILYLRYLLSNYKHYYKDEYNELLGMLPSSILEDLKAISKESQKYPDLIPKVRDSVYDYYLKSHGVKEGLKNYSKIIEMVASWNNSDWFPELQELTEN